MKKEIGIRFGMLSSGIAKQLRDQGFSYSEKVVADFQKSLQCIHRLAIQNILNEKAEKAAYNKLFTKIKAHVRIKNKKAKS